MRDNCQAKQVIAAADLIRSVANVGPQAAIILGSGLGGLANKIDHAVSIDFADVPGFQSSTALGHRGQLILGTFESLPMVAMAGRIHRYEGWSNDDVAFPVEVIAALGVSRLIVSNAAGGINPKLRVGDIVVIADHIHWMGGSFHWNRQSSFPAFTRPDQTYDSVMANIAMETAVAGGFSAYQGTYLATLGPNYETRAEYRMMRRLGADVVGMSTTAEVLTASNLGMRVLGLSTVTNVANPDNASKADHTEVLKAGRAAEDKIEAILRSVLRPAADS